MLMLAAIRVRLWWTIFRVSLDERLVYRADFALGTLMRFLPIVTHILMFRAIYTAVNGDNIAGYTFRDMVAYQLLIMISRAFSSMPTLASDIAFQIREGEIKKYLIQPIDMIGFLLLKRVAWKLVYYGVAIVPFSLVFYLCRSYFPGWPDATTIAVYVMSLGMAFLMGFFLEATIGIIGFWFLEISSLLLVYNLFNYLLSGHMFPLEMLQKMPAAVEWLFHVLPFKYLAYFPASIFLGKVQGAALIYGLGTQFAWLIFFFGLCRLAYGYGLKRYSGFGG